MFIRLICVVFVSCLAAISFGVAGSGAAADDFSRRELNALTSERDAAEAALRALETAETDAEMDVFELEQRLLEASMESQRREAQATAAEGELVSLKTRKTLTERTLLQGEIVIDDLLAALAISGRHRPPAWITHVDDANLAIRSAILMGYAAPQMKAETNRLASELEELQTLEQSITMEISRLEAAEANLALRRAEIVQMTAVKRNAFEDVRSNTSSMRERVTQLGQEADSVRDLLSALEDRAPSAPGVKPFLQLAAASPNNAGRRSMARPSRRGQLDPNLTSLIGELNQPAVGRQVRKWGDRMPGGSTAQGLAFATRAQAQVTAPVTGQVEFAGPFRTYGQLLIISTSDEYHVLLSGMSNAYVSVGQIVVQGEPVARMPNRATPEPELYMEVRYEGEPMDPERWMRRS